MFKKFINEVAKSIKEEVKEEFGIKDRKDVFKELKEGAKEVDDIKNYLKQELTESRLTKNDVGEIADEFILGGSGIGKELAKTKILDKPTEKINTLINKVGEKIPEESLFSKVHTENGKEYSKLTTVNENKIINENKMLSENLNSLIEFALADGELSEKEKQILFKKAETEGIDLDEFEMILEAKLFQIKQMQTQPKPIENINVAPKSDKFGDIKKCPVCGAIVESFSTKCIDCGYNFSNITANNSVQKLFDMINELESKRGDEETNPLKAFGAVLSKSFGVSIGDRINNQKKELISNFPIPNTKNDIIEFLALALPKARKAGNFFTSGNFNSPANDRNKIHNEFVPVWKNKCEQIIMKARFSMKEDKKTLEEIEFYAQQIGIK